MVIMITSIVIKMTRKVIFPVGNVIKMVKSSQCNQLVLRRSHRIGQNLIRLFLKASLLTSSVPVG